MTILKSIAATPLALSSDEKKISHMQRASVPVHYQYTTDKEDAGGILERSDKIAYT